MRGVFNKQASKLQTHGVVVGLIFVLMILEFLGSASTVVGLLDSIFRPIKVTAHSLTRSVEAPFFTLKRSLNSARKVQMLEYRYSETLAQLADLEGLKKENEQLRQLLENSDRQAREVVISVPVVSNLGPTIGSGSDEGIEVGDLVFVSGTLVGRVSKVGETFSNVHLLNQKDVAPIVVQTGEGYKGVIKGDGRRIILTEVLPDEIPAPESKIVTLGQVGVDSDHLVGQVGKELSSDSDPVKTFAVIQFVDFYQAKVVEVYK